MRVVWLVDLYKRATNRDLRISIIAVQYKSVGEPSHAYVRARLDDDVVFADTFITTVTAEVIDTVDTAWVNTQHDFNVLRVRKIDVIAFGLVHGVKIGGALLASLEVGAFEVAVLVRVFASDRVQLLVDVDLQVALDLFYRDQLSSFENEMTYQIFWRNFMISHTVGVLFHFNFITLSC